jgi:hypothetical protein
VSLRGHKHIYHVLTKLLRTHVFNDLEPYLCLFAHCPLGVHTYKSRREWMEHEFLLHRVAIQWRCNLCKEVYESTDTFRTHISTMHADTIAASQVEEVVSASKRPIPCEVRHEQCPFCLTSPSQTQKGFASHVGKHQQEISLAALPRFEEMSDDSDSDDNDIDDNESSSSTIGGANNKQVTISTSGISDTKNQMLEGDNADKVFEVNENPSIHQKPIDRAQAGASNRASEHAIISQGSQTSALDTSSETEEARLAGAALGAGKSVDPRSNQEKVCIFRLSLPTPPIIQT